MAEAQKAIKAGQQEQARKLLRQASRQDPTDHRPWLWLAGLSPSPAASLAFLDRAASLHPGDPTIDQALSWAESRQKQVVPPARVLSKPHNAIWRDAGWMLAGALVLLVLIVFSGTFDYLWPLRLLLGLAFALFVPGYWLISALFPRAGDLDGVERLALSIGLSVAVIAPMALILDWLPWGIRLWPIVVAYGVYYTILIPLVIYRRRRLPPEERFVPQMELDLKGWWGSQDRVNRIIYFVLLGAFLLAVFSATAIILLPKPGEHFTEFYMLGPEGLAESFPREVTPGEPLSVILGITNRERGPHSYRVEAWAVDPWEADRRELVGGGGTYSLEPGQTHEWPLTWSMPWPGEDQQVQFLLYLDNNPEPYRQLRLWLDVTHH